MSGTPKIHRYKNLTTLAQRLRHDVTADDVQCVLLYAYNRTGKTRLSMEFKDIGKRKGQGTPDTLYFNAFTEDLFVWHNDLDADTDRHLTRRNTVAANGIFHTVGELAECPFLVDRNVAAAIQPWHGCKCGGFGGNNGRFALRHRWKRDGERGEDRKGGAREARYKQMHHASLKSEPEQDQSGFSARRCAAPLTCARQRHRGDAENDASVRRCVAHHGDHRRGREEPLMAMAWAARPSVRQSPAVMALA